MCANCGSHCFSTLSHLSLTPTLGGEPLIMPISRWGVRIVPPTSRRALAQCHRECQRGPALHPHPSCSPPAAGRGKQCLQTQSRAGPWQVPRVGDVRALPAPSGTCRHLERGTNRAMTRGSALRGTVQTTRLTPAEIGPRGCQRLSPHCCCWISWFSDGNCRLIPAPGPPPACEGAR